MHKYKFSWTLKIPVLMLYTFNMTQKYRIAKIFFEYFQNTVGVSSVNYVYLLTRTREKQRETERDVNMFTTRRKSGGGEELRLSRRCLSCFVPLLFPFIVRIILCSLHTLTENVNSVPAVVFRSSENLKDLE